MKSLYKNTALIISFAALSCAFIINPVASAIGGHHGSNAIYNNVASRGMYVTSAPQHLHRSINHEDCPYVEDCDCPYANADYTQDSSNVDTQNNQSQSQNQNQQQPQAQGYGYGRGAHAHQGRGRHYANHEDCPYAMAE